MRRKALAFLFFLSSSLAADPGLIALGGGYYFAGRRHSGGLIQAEYKWHRTYWKVVRPQVELIVPEFKSVFVGVGFALEFYLTKHLVFSPNFSPGLYYRGQGRHLGYPLEFRSCLELAYEWNNKARLGTQFYHISNASLGRKNPGANALTCFLAFPL